MILVYQRDKLSCLISAGIAQAGAHGPSGKGVFPAGRCSTVSACWAVFAQTSQLCEPAPAVTASGVVKQQAAFTGFRPSSST